MILERHTQDYANTSQSLQETAVAEDPEVSCMLAFNDFLAAHISGDKEKVSRLRQTLEVAFGFSVNITRPWPTA
jgi:hypothetical protein